jgi:hypothetical protein
MKIALFYASWENYGEPWNTPVGLRNEFLSRGHEICQYNLYHNDGDFLPQKKIRSYSGDCFNRFSVDYRNGYRPDAVIVMDYGPFDYVGMDKRLYPDVAFILEAGDTPQSMRCHAQKVRKFHGVVTPDYECAEAFKHVVEYSEWMPHWADHRVFHTGYDIDPVFDMVSTCGGRRHTAKIQEALGERFNNERYFYGEEHAKRLCMGNIVFQCSQFGELTRRIFEGMACNRMVLTDRLPPNTEIDRLFTENEHIVYYDTPEDAVRKVNYYTENPAERNAIAFNGWREVNTNHTVSNRADQFEDMIQRISSDIKQPTS